MKILVYLLILIQFNVSFGKPKNLRSLRKNNMEIKKNISKSARSEIDEINKVNQISQVEFDVESSEEYLGEYDSEELNKDVFYDDPLERKYRYQVYVRASRFKRERICAGYILSKLHVLTAAHCVYYFDMKSIMIIGNKEYLTSTFRYFSDVNSITFHKEYNPYTAMHDLAIVQVTKTFEFSKLLYPVNMRKNPVPSGYVCTQPRWGPPSEVNGLPADVEYREVIMMERSQCENIFKSNFIDNIFCGWTKGNLDCRYEGCAALLCDEELVGLATNEMECRNPRFPDLYFNVTYYLSWINEVIRETPEMFSELAMIQSGATSQMKSTFVTFIFIVILTWRLLLL